MTRQPDVRTAQTHPIGIRTARYDKGLAELAGQPDADMLADMLGVGEHDGGLRGRVGLHPSVRELPPRLRRRKACGTGRREDFAREVSHA